MANRRSRPRSARSRPERAKYRFLTTEATVPGLDRLQSTALVFPQPFTLGDYKRYRRALRPETSDEEEDAMFLQFRAALNVASLHDVEPEEGEDPDAIPLGDLDPDSDDLNMALLTWVLECANACIGPLITVEKLEQTIARRQTSGHHSPTYSTRAYLNMFPDLEDYPGHVTFASPLTKRVYTRWDEARQVDEKFPAGDPENSMLVRQWRAALPLVEKWEVEGVDWSLTQRKGGDDVPLVLASWLVEVADDFLAARLPLAQLLAGYATGR